MLRCILLSAGLLGSLVFASAPAGALELVMIQREGCVWCARFNAEVAPRYPRTAEGRAAPLRRVDLAAPWPADLAGIEPDRFTPTFVLVDRGREIGRIRGYPGDDMFWGLLGRLIERSRADGSPRPLTGRPLRLLVRPGEPLD